MAISGEDAAMRGSDFRLALDGLGSGALRANLYGYGDLVALSRVEQLQPLFIEIQKRKPDYKPLRMKHLFDDWVLIQLREMIGRENPPARHVQTRLFAEIKPSWAARRESAIRGATHSAAFELVPHGSVDSRHRGDAESVAIRTLHAMDDLTPYRGTRGYAYATTAVVDAGTALSIYRNIPNVEAYHSSETARSFWDRMAEDATNLIALRRRMDDHYSKTDVFTVRSIRAQLETIVVALGMNPERSIHDALKVVNLPGMDDTVVVVNDVAAEKGLSLYGAAEKL